MKFLFAAPTFLCVTALVVFDAGAMSMPAARPAVPLHRSPPYRMGHRPASPIRCQVSGYSRLRQEKVIQGT